MGLKTFRPLTPTNRFKVLPDFQEITKSKPEKRLVEAKPKTGGRNNNGRITTRHIGGGHKQKYRLVDFKRKKAGEASVIAIEYDPNRTCRIALIEYADKERAYILAPAGLVVGNKVAAGAGVEAKVGCALPLAEIPLGLSIHNVELQPGRGGQMARSAGAYVILNNREGDYALLKLPSGEIRRVHVQCKATIGQVGNVDHMNVSAGKAGRSRWKGVRPTVRGMAMNPIDHPMGGGQGKSKGGGGRHHPMSPWGQLSKGFKTRRKHKPSDRFILQRKNSTKKAAI
jgi:large subunit ribosomal protein L2